MSVEPVGHMNLAEAVVFAVCDSCDILLCTLEETEIVLLVNDLADRLVQVAQSFSVECLLFCHFIYYYYRIYTQH